MPKVMNFLVTSLVILQFTVPAWASGCVTFEEGPNALHEYIVARDSTEDYAIIEGTFKAMGSRPQRQVEGEYYEWRGRFVGRALGPEGFTIPYNQVIRYRFTCTPYDCPQVTPAGRVMSAIKLSDRHPTIYGNECWKNDIKNEETLRRVERCHLHGQCDF